MIFLTGKAIGKITTRTSLDFGTTLEFKPSPDVRFYHNGNGSRPTPALAERPIIAWDGEGMNLSGDQKPQHYVLFGCSADLDNPLASRDLTAGDILRYITEIGARHPDAVHIGYGFRYDANMIVRHLPLRCLTQLRQTGRTFYNYGGDHYRIHWLPGKRFQVTRMWGKGQKQRTTVTIDDVIAFFACSFMKATESILADELTDEDREVIAHGKAERGSNLWDDLPDVQHYWRAEIRLMARLMVRFREVMYASGFMLRDWYGPGALSSYLIRQQGLRSHIVNGPPDIPDGVHRSSKHAYAGGRFELFRMGTFTGPIYSLDINSAYPFAISQAPSLGKGHGFWRHVESPKTISYFGVYRIRFHADGAGPFEPRPMPLFHRDTRGNISFPNVCHGWYWSPEASMVAGCDGVEICEGWEWIPAEPALRPFGFLADMYAARQKIGKANVMSMPYKLGPNSLYGKFAQRVGFTTDPDGNCHPPRSHCLPLAGWVTSYTRAMLYNVLRQVPRDRLIAVETDGIYMAHDPAGLDGVVMGSGLGEWDATVYDELLYVQSGVYHRRSGSQWLPAKSRGLDSASIALPVVREYLERCLPGTFPSLRVTMRPRFVGLTAAMAGTAPVKVRHCRWEAGERDLEPGGKGKRVHIPEMCGACRQGLSAAETGHTLFVRSRSTGEMSAPHFLPWESGKQYPDMTLAEELDEINGDMPL
jgi:hypothetical protein